jgi:hypothetical protein
MVDLELVVITCCRRLIEMENVVRQRFTWPVGKEIAANAPQRVRKGTAGRFQVTLEAKFVLSFRREPRRIDNRSSDLRKRAAGGGILHMRPSWTMTALAINPFWNCAAQKKVRSFDIISRVGVVTEEAFPIDLAPKIHVVCAIVPRIHRPHSTPIAVPGDRQFYELAICPLMKVSACMFARAKDEVNLHFDDVCFVAVGTDLMAPLVKAALTLVHREVLVRGFVIVGVMA